MFVKSLKTNKNLWNGFSADGTKKWISIIYLIVDRVSTCNAKFIIINYNILD